MPLLKPSLLLYPAIGFGIGAFYFTGLWWTVCRLKTSRRPTVLTMVSFGLRAALALMVFYLASQGHWERFLGCLAGFVLARLAVTRGLRPRAIGEGQPSSNPSYKGTDR